MDNVYYDEEYAVIPEGTVLPLTVDRCLNARVVKEGQEFIARTPFNFVTREKYIVLPIGVQIAGKVHKVQRPTRFIKNGYFWLLTSNVLDDKKLWLICPKCKNFPLITPKIDNELKEISINQLIFN